MSKLIDRTSKYVVHDEVSGCDIWVGSTDGDGYPILTINGISGIRVHRELWEELYGKLLEEECVCHRCNNRGCLNPAHLYKGSHKQNMADTRKNGRFFTSEEVLDIRVNGESERKTATRYNVSRSTINRIRSGILDR